METLTPVRTKQIILCFQPILILEMLFLIRKPWKARHENEHLPHQTNKCV